MLENVTMFMTIALGLSAMLVFGGGVLISKSVCSDKVQKKEEKRDNNSASLIIAAIMISAGLIFGGGVLISYAVRTDNTHDSESETAEEPFTDNQENVTTEKQTFVQDITKTTTDITTNVTIETTTIEITTTIAVSEIPTESETETETVQLPLEQVQANGKGNEGGFFTTYYSDNSIIIEGIITESSGLTTYDDIYGDHTSVIIPKSVNNYTIRGIGISSLSMGYVDLDWSGVKEVSVPIDMKFTLDYVTEISFEEAESYFTRYGINLTQY